MNPRAIEYRRIYDIPDHIGTAVNVQMMVFGNTGDRSGTGVGFTRNPATGAKEFYGEFLINAQGEDVVSGVRTPQPIRELEQVMPKAYAQLRQITTRLEKHYKDVQDFEFTIQDERLYMLQTRSAKRPAQAAVRFAIDAVGEGLLDREAALLTIDPSALDALLHPTFDPNADYEVIAGSFREDWVKLFNTNPWFGTQWDTSGMVNALYDIDLGRFGLPFIYPPFAAIAFIPLIHLHFDTVKQLVKVIPVEYRSVLAKQHLDTDAARLASI